MRKIADLYVEIGANISGLKKGLDNASSSLDRLGRKMQVAGRRLSLAVTAPLAAVGAAAIKTGMDAIESENLFEVSMKGMADAARKWSDELSSSLGLNRFEIRKTVGTFNVMLKSMGLSEKAAFDMAKGLSQLAYDMASFYNLKPEEAFLKLQSGISGEIEPLKRLGILVNENTIKHYALTQGIIKQGETLSEQQKVLARYGVIMEQTSDAQGDLARTLDSPANKMRALRSRITELSAEIGMKLLPAFVEILRQVEKVVKWFSNLSEANKSLVIKIATLTAAIGPLLLVSGKLISAFVALRAGGLGIVPVLGKLGAAALVAYGAYKLLIAAREKWEKATGKYTSEETKRWAKLTEQIGGWSKFAEEAAKKFVPLKAGAEAYRKKLAEINNIWNKYGQNTEKTLKAIASGKHGKDLKKFLDELGGKHLDAAKEASGQEKTLEDLEEEAGNLAETIGSKLNNGLQGLVGGFQDAGEAARENKKEIEAWDTAIKNLNTHIKNTLSDTIPKTSGAINYLTGEINSAVESTGSMGDYWADNMLKILKSTENTTENVGERVSRLTTLWNQMADGLKTKWATTISDVLSGAKSLKEGLKGIWDAIKEQFFDMIGQMIAKWVTDFIGGILDGISSAASSIAKEIGGALGGGGTSSIADGISAVTSGVASLANPINMISGAVTAIASVASALQGPGGPSTTDSWHFEHIWKNVKELRDWAFINAQQRLDNLERFSGDRNAKIDDSNTALRRIRSILDRIKGDTGRMANALGDVTFAQHGFSGVVTSPTLFMAGENGAEAVNVAPLSQSSPAGHSEKIEVKMNPAPVHIYIDGKEAAMAMAKYVPELTRKQVWRIHERSLTDKR